MPLTAGYTIAGKLYNDADASFNSSDSEAPYAGVTVALLKRDGTPVLDKDGNPVTAVTDDQGKYSFRGLPLGEYTVSVVDPTSGPLAGTKPTEALSLLLLVTTPGWTLTVTVSRTPMSRLCRA